MVIQSGATQTPKYFHRDHLGSISVVTNEAGQVIERLSYDAFGKRRIADWRPDSTDALLKVGHETDYGFTDHEQIDHVSLIHMNGRVYDPITGRFTSADPYIQFPENSQSFNRYSYVLNYPLTYTDPSGFGIKKFFKRIGRELERWGKQIEREFKGANIYVGTSCDFGGEQGTTCTTVPSRVPGNPEYDQNAPDSVQGYEPAPPPPPPEGETGGASTAISSMHSANNGTGVDTAVLAPRLTRRVSGDGMDNPMFANGEGTASFAYALGSELPSLPQDVVDFSAGLGDALLLGFGDDLRAVLGGDGGIDRASDVYFAGELASLAVGGARIAYAASAKALSIIGRSIGGMTGASIASGGRNALKGIFRLGLMRGYRRPPFSDVLAQKGGDVDEVISAAGRTNRAFNIFGVQAGGGAAANRIDHCLAEPAGCQ